MNGLTQSGLIAGDRHAVVNPVVYSVFEWFLACALLRPSAESEYQLSEAVRREVRARYSVETVRFGEWLNVNTRADMVRASELVREEKANDGC